jgi:hypothetical protein
MYDIPVEKIYLLWVEPSKKLTLLRSREPAASCCDADLRVFCVGVHFRGERYIANRF